MAEGFVGSSRLDVLTARWSGNQAIASHSPIKAEVTSISDRLNRDKSIQLLLNVMFGFLSPQGAGTWLWPSLRLCAAAGVSVAAFSNQACIASRWDSACAKRIDNSPSPLMGLGGNGNFLTQNVLR